MNLITVGMKVTFVPSCFGLVGLTFEQQKAVAVTGEVTFVNYGKKTFTAEYKTNNSLFRETFKFSDLGKDVTVCGCV